VASVLRSWVEVLQTQNLSSQRPVDPVSRWLLITRASVLPMTVISAAPVLDIVNIPAATHFAALERPAQVGRAVAAFAVRLAAS
jgi:hypothetical protein